MPPCDTAARAELRVFVSDGGSAWFSAMIIPGERLKHLCRSPSRVLSREDFSYGERSCVDASPWRNRSEIWRACFSLDRARVIDYSAGGLQLEGTFGLIKTDHIQIEFISGARVPARVAWSLGAQTGVVFSEPELSSPSLFGITLLLLIPGFSEAASETGSVIFSTF